MKRTIPIILCVLAIGLFSGAATAAPVPGAIDRHVIAGGGGTVSDGVTFVLESTIAEPVASTLDTASTPRMGAGYWEDLAFDFDVFLPVVTR